MESPDPNWDYATFNAEADDAKGVLFQLPYQYKHAREIADMSVWKILDAAHTMTIGVAVMRAGGKLNPALVGGAQKLLDRAEVVRDEMLVYAAAQGVSVQDLATGMDVSKSTAQKRLEAARRRHGAATEWVSGRPAGDLPETPRDIAYRTVNGIAFDNKPTTAGEWFLFESIPHGAKMTCGDFTIARLDGTEIVVGFRGFSRIDGDRIELRTESGQLAYLVEDESAEFRPEDIPLG